MTYAEYYTVMLKMWLDMYRLKKISHCKFRNMKDEFHLKNKALDFCPGAFSIIVCLTIPYVIQPYSVYFIQPKGISIGIVKMDSRVQFRCLKQRIYIL